MKLIIAIIDEQYSNKVVRKLMSEKIRTTKLASTGGFLSKGNTTLLIGVDENQVDRISELIAGICKKSKVKSKDGEVTVRANLFIVPIDSYHRV
ncbi:MAG: cyclic-di-AMP receptor [Bacillota bacterium]